MKTRHCDECRHRNRFVEGDRNNVCKKGHNPRFYQPISALDTNYGWKRKCTDFEEKKK